MADLIRPEARAILWRWRDLWVALAVALLGLWAVSRSFGVLYWVGWGLILLGLVLAVLGVQRALFRQGNDGPGVVTVVEGRLAYFGPLTGGVMDMADITRLALEPQAKPSPHWILTGIEGTTLEIPITAGGAEALFDVFASLPGIRTAKMLDVLAHTPDQRVVIWSKSQPLLH